MSLNPCTRIDTSFWVKEGRVDDDPQGQVSISKCNLGHRGTLYAVSRCVEFRVAAPNCLYPSDRALGWHEVYVLCGPRARWNTRISLLTAKEALGFLDPARWMSLSLMWYTITDLYYIIVANGDWPFAIPSTPGRQGI